MNDQISYNITLLFFLTCFFVSAYFICKLFLPFLSIIVLGAIITGIFYPIYDFIRIKCDFSDIFASLLTCLMILLILFVPTAFFIRIVIQEASELVQLIRSPEMIDLLNKLFGDSYFLKKIKIFFEIVVSGDKLNATVSQVGSVGLFLYTQARAVASNTLALVINSFMMLLIIFFLLIDGKKIVQFVIDLSPLPREQDEKLIGKFSDMAGAILIGNGLCGAMQGIAGGLLFWFFNLPSAFLWGVIMCFLAFLPIIGIGMVMIPASIFLFLKGRVIESLLMVVFYILFSAGTEYIFKPKVVGHRVKMHTLMIFLSFVGGLKVFGIIGIIYGPLITTAFLTLTEIYRINYRGYN